jgi:outer membrane protein TolC
MSFRSARSIAAVSAAIGIFGAAVAQAESTPPPAPAVVKPLRPVYGLARCLELADRNYPKIQEARAKLGQKQAQYDQSKTAPFSEFTFTAGLAAAPTVQGTALYSPSSDLPITSKMAPAWQFGVDGVVPLWTFGKITNLWDAAAAQVKVGENEVRKERNDLRLAVRRVYYGVLLTRDALLLVHEALARVDKYVDRLEEKVAKGDGDEIDLLKLKIQREELIVRESEATKQQAIAFAGLKFYTGLSNGVDVPDHPLARLSHNLAPLARYLSAARLYRPEINMARAGVLAREAQLRIERARFFPDLGLALSAHYLNAPEVTDQRNPFVHDAGHSQAYGAALVLRYKLDFFPQSARYDQATAQLEEQRATERYALGGVGVEVEQAFREAEDAQRRLDAYTRATTYAKRWLIQVQQGIDVGTFEDADVVDPAKEYALKRFSQMSATFDYNMAVAKLAQTTGWDQIAREE